MKAILLAGGDARRTLPLTHGMYEKTFLRLKGKPIISIVLEQIYGWGLGAEITVCVLDKFLEDFKWELRNNGLQFNSTPRALGTLGHYMKAAHETGISFDDDVLVYYGDTITNMNLGAMYDSYKKLGSECIIAVTTNLRHDYSAVDFDREYRITKMDEKPKLDFPSWTGIAIIKHELIERCIGQIAPDKMDFAKGLFPLLLKNGAKFHAYSDDNALYYDTGNINSYLKLMDMAAEGTLNV